MAWWRHQQKYWCHHFDIRVVIMTLNHFCIIFKLKVFVLLSLIQAFNKYLHVKYTLFLLWVQHGACRLQNVGEIEENKFSLSRNPIFILPRSWHHCNDYDLEIYDDAIYVIMMIYVSFIRHLNEYEELHCRLRSARIPETTVWIANRHVRKNFHFDKWGMSDKIPKHVDTMRKDPYWHKSQLIILWLFDILYVSKVPYSPPGPLHKFRITKSSCFLF
jgi:hypothetical protein